MSKSKLSTLMNEYVRTQIALHGHLYESSDGKLINEARAARIALETFCAGQFSAEDVRILRVQQKILDESNSDTSFDIADDRLARFYESLADRIEALLSPE